MKIGDALKYYSNYLSVLQKKRDYLVQKKEEQKEAGIKPDVDTIELTIKAIDNDSKNIRLFTEQLRNTKMDMENMEQSKEAAEAEKEKWDDMLKCLKIFRRIAKGDHVPHKDEKKLMDFSLELYLAAKNMAAMHKNEKTKDHDSLWKDEETENETDNAPEIDERENPLETPQLSNIAADIDVEIE